MSHSGALLTTASLTQSALTRSARTNLSKPQIFLPFITFFFKGNKIVTLQLASDIHKNVQHHGKLTSMCNVELSAAADVSDWKKLTFPVLG